MNEAQTDWWQGGFRVIEAHMNRLAVRAQVLTCEACELSARCTAPVPMSGQFSAKLAVLGEAPGAEEDAQGEPFVGPAGRTLRAAMRNVGLNPDEFAYLNTVSCFPNRDGKGRAPMLGEVQACAQNREDQLHVSGAAWVILTGNVPLQAYRPDLRIGRAHGQPIVKLGSDKIVMFPVYHPAAVLRNRSWLTEFERDLSTFKEMVDRDAWAWVPIRCVSCGRVEDAMTRLYVDDWGVNYCQDCAPASETRVDRTRVELA